MNPMNKSEEILTELIAGRITKEAAIEQLTALDRQAMGEEEARQMAEESVFIALGGSDVEDKQ